MQQQHAGIGWHPLAPLRQVSGLHGIVGDGANSHHADCKSVADVALAGSPNETARWAPVHLRDADRLMQKKPEVDVPGATYSGVIQLHCGSKGINAREEIAEDKWLSRQELADRYGLAVKTPADTSRAWPKTVDLCGLWTRTAMTQASSPSSSPACGSVKRHRHESTPP
jgi:hypothetical protein